MLSHEENELLCRVEGEAPGGEAARRYWLPARYSEEVPKRTALRPRAVGRPEVHRVPDRPATWPSWTRGAAPPRLAGSRAQRRRRPALHLRLEVRRQRACVEMPTEPPGSRFRRAWARSVSGARSRRHRLVLPRRARTRAAVPGDRLDHAAARDVGRIKFVENCNYVQATEGAIDTAHSWFLHRGDVPDWQQRLGLSTDFSPRLEAEDTPYGFRYAAIRKPSDDPDTSATSA